MKNLTDRLYAVVDFSLIDMRQIKKYLINKDKTRLRKSVDGSNLAIIKFNRAVWRGQPDCDADGRPNKIKALAGIMFYTHSEILEEIRDNPVWQSDETRP